jgi:hypothetical protein
MATTNVLPAASGKGRLIDFAQKAAFFETLIHDYQLIVK